jgi:lysylphosphatidylglycerol synthetase-like protein (DUF2156 family)
MKIFVPRGDLLPPFLGGGDPMGWGADGSAFAVTGALFLLCGAIASGPLLRARLPVLVSILTVAAVFIAAAFLSRTFGGWTASQWTWCAALLPLALMAVLGTRAAVSASHSHPIVKCLAPQRAARDRAVIAQEATEAAGASRLRAASDPAASGTDLADLAYAHPELRLAIAINPATPANVLGWLASSGGDGVTDAIARRSSADPTDDGGVPGV